MYTNPNHYINPTTEFRKINMQKLGGLARLIILPENWKLIEAEASLRFENKDKSKVVKVCSSCTLFLDVTTNGVVHSNTFKCRDVDEVWRLVIQTLKAYLGKPDIPMAYRFVGARR